MYPCTQGYPSKTDFFLGRMTLHFPTFVHANCFLPPIFSRHEAKAVYVHRGDSKTNFHVVKVNQKIRDDFPNIGGKGGGTATILFFTKLCGSKEEEGRIDNGDRRGGGFKYFIDSLVLFWGKGVPTFVACN